MKKAPFKEYQKKTGRMPFIGTTQDESFRRQREYERTGCNVYDAKVPKSQPLGFWTKQDVLRYSYEPMLDICDVYGDIVFENGIYRTTGVDRTGCMFCAFGAHLEAYPNRFQRMQMTHPRHHEYCMRDWDKGGLGLNRVLDYINVPYYCDVDVVKNKTQSYQQYKMII